MRQSLRKVWFACYEGEGGEGDAAAEAAAAAAAAAAATAADKVATQDQLNAVLKREKEKYRKEREKLVQQLEEHKSNVRLTTEQKEALETQIEELRQATMTTEEKARHQQTKLQKDYEAKLEATTIAAKTWEQRFQDLKIGHTLTNSALTHEVLSNSVVLVEALLRPSTRLVQDVGEDGQPLDSWTAKVKFADNDKDGKPIVLDLTVDEAVKRMKELPDKFGNLFKGTANGGLGGSTGAAGKKPNLDNMSTEQYMEQRKKDPASVGLR